MEWMTKALYNMIAKARQETFELNGWIKVTPIIAKSLLRYNIRNYRSLKHPVVEKYANEMKSGKWIMNGEPIVISKDGLVRNGQHRLEAVVASGVSVVMYVIFDADPCETYDLHSKRTCVQILKAMGYPICNLGPSTARIIFTGKAAMCEHGDMEVCNYVVDHYEAMKKAVKIVKTKIGKVKTVGNIAACAAVVYCMLRTGEMSESELTDFFRVMNSDKKCGLRRDVSSALTLRKQIYDIDGHGDNITNKYMEWTYLALKDFHNKVAIVGSYSDDGKNAARLIHEVQCMDGFCSATAA